MTELAVRLRGVTAGYGHGRRERPVLAGVDLDIAPGESLALLGPNGGGKTTLLRVVSGTVRPTGGSVELFGRPGATWSRREVARTVAVLPQSLELPPGFRVSEVVAMGRTPHAAGMLRWAAEDERAVADALRDADADSLADRPVAELSGGERQRVIVALALAQEPRLLLMDEPTTHLDAAHTSALLASISRLRRTRGVTVVVVLHDLPTASAWAPRVVLLVGGRVAADGPPATALNPRLVREAYGVSAEPAITAGGRTILVPDVPYGG